MDKENNKTPNPLQPNLDIPTQQNIPQQPDNFSVQKPGSTNSITYDSGIILEQPNNKPKILIFIAIGFLCFVILISLIILAWNLIRHEENLPADSSSNKSAPEVVQPKQTTQATTADDGKTLYKTECYQIRVPKKYIVSTNNGNKCGLSSNNITGEQIHISLSNSPKSTQAQIDEQVSGYKELDCKISQAQPETNVFSLDATGCVGTGRGENRAIYRFSGEGTKLGAYPGANGETLYMLVIGGQNVKTVATDLYKNISAL